MTEEFEKVIVTDADGVLFNWEYAFHTWAKTKGYERKADSNYVYDIAHQYDIPKEESRELIREFNQSAAIGFLPPHRDAIHYVKQLHEKKGYVFHLVTSLSLCPHAQALRTQNIKKLFGETAFVKFVYLDTGADKDEVLLDLYEGKDYLWVEDKPENAEAGAKVGLTPVVMEHGHNMDHTDCPVVKNWKEIYEMVN